MKRQYRFIHSVWTVLRRGSIICRWHFAATRARDSTARGRSFIRIRILSCSDGENRFLVVRTSVVGGLFAVVAHHIDKQRRSAVRINIAICQTLENGSCLFLSDAVEYWCGCYATIKRVYYAIWGGVSSTIASEGCKAGTACR
jgi:hypothetical protein